MGLSALTLLGDTSFWSLPTHLYLFSFAFCVVLRDCEISILSPVHTDWHVTPSGLSSQVLSDRSVGQVLLEVQVKIQSHEFKYFLRSRYDFHMQSCGTAI